VRGFANDHPQALAHLGQPVAAHVHNRNRSVGTREALELLLRITGRKPHVGDCAARDTRGLEQASAIRDQVHDANGRAVGGAAKSAAQPILRDAERVPRAFQQFQTFGTDYGFMTGESPIKWPPDPAPSSELLRAPRLGKRSTTSRSDHFASDVAGL
jgi:hypothetical protein